MVPAGLVVPRGPERASLNARTVTGAATPSHLPDRGAGKRPAKCSLVASGAGPRHEAGRGMADLVDTERSHAAEQPVNELERPAFRLNDRDYDLPGPGATATPLAGSLPPLPLWSTVCCECKASRVKRRSAHAAWNFL